MSEIFSHAGIWILLLAVVAAIVRATRRSLTNSTATEPEPTQS